MTTMREMLSNHPFLDSLAPEHLTALSTWARRSPIPAGSNIFTEGGRAERFWLIRDGHVTLDTHVPGRGAVVIETLGPGAVLGWSWMFSPYTWQFSATAVEPTLTIEFNAANVRRICAENPALGYELTRRFTSIVFDRLQATRIRLLDLYRTP
jgi:CRP-like cAMP-binding protein